MTTAIILAGGLGTRLRSAVPDLPKPLAPIADRPFLEHQIDYWSGQGVDDIILSVGYRADLIQAHFGQCYRGLPVRYAIETEPLGTGGGLLLAAAQLHDSAPFLLLNGDTYFAVDLARLQAFHCEHQSDWTFSLFRAREEGRYMRTPVSADSRILSFSADKGAIGDLANGGVYLINPAALQRVAAGFCGNFSIEADLLPALQTQGGRIFGLECSGDFIDIGVPEDYFRAASLIA